MWLRKYTKTREKPVEIFYKTDKKFTLTSSAMSKELDKSSFFKLLI